MEAVQYFSFTKDNIPLKDSPKCGLTLRAAGSMRFRWKEKNERRDLLLAKIAEDKIPTPIQLSHSKILYQVKEALDTKDKIGDGIVTKNKQIMPVVTVADCLPIYFYERKNQAFGIVHSGWKGTGIIQNALEILQSEYKASLEDIFIVIGPHIQNCCYIVNKERADYFLSNFEYEEKFDMPDSIPQILLPLEEGGTCFAGGKNLPPWNNGDGPLYRLSLLRANLNIIRKVGIPLENINIIKECTCCNDIYGSNRRETSLQALADSFTIQAAFIRW